MGLPDIFDKFARTPENKKVFFWALEIFNGGVKSAIWTLENGKSMVVAIGSEEDWDGGVEDLIEATDKSLAVASERFIGQGDEPSQVILGLPDDWTVENKILPERQQILQEVCKKLELKPVGFVSIFDGIVHYFKDIDGSPVSAIIINLEKENINVVLVEVGQIKGIQKVRRSSNLGDDLYEGLLRFENVEVYPSRMILYGGEDAEAEKQSIMNYQWISSGEDDRKPHFLHFPKVEALPSDFDISAVAIAGGGEVAKSLGFEISEPVVIDAAVQEEVIEEDSEGNDFGFVKGKDIQGEIPVEEEEPSEQPKIVPEVIPVTPFSSSNSMVIEREVRTSSRPNFNIRSLISKFIPKFGISGSIGKIVLVVGLILIGGALAVYGIALFIPKAEIIVYVSPKVLTKEIEITVDQNQEAIDIKNLIIPGQIIEVEEAGEKTAPATGEKTVGDKATGEVTIYNRTEAKKIFPAGTALLGPGGLRYVIDREVTVASKTPDLTSGVDKWGESKVTVTAADIGAQYNLAQSSQFTIKDISVSSFLGKNLAPLSGGTSRQITAVSEKDQTSLLKSLSDELKEKGKKDIQMKALSGQKILDDSVTTKESLTNYNYKVGDEAQNLTLKLTVKTTALVVDESQFLLLAEGVLSGEVPLGYELNKEDIVSSFDVKKRNTDGSMILTTNFVANLLPKVDVQEIISKIKGKSKNSGENYLRSSITGYETSDIVFSPGLPGPLQYFSMQAEKINIEIRSR